MTEFYWRPKDRAHFMEMFRNSPSDYELARLAGTSRGAVVNYRLRHKIPSRRTLGNPRLSRRQAMHLAHVAAADRAIGTPPYRAQPLLSEEQIAALLGGRRFRDDPRAVRGRL